MTTAAFFKLPPRFLPSALKWRAREWRRRVRRGFRYVFGGLTKDDAEWMILDIEPVAESFSIARLSVESVLQRAEEVWEDHPDLPALARSATYRVSHKHPGIDGDAIGAAEDWALDLIEEYAKQEGVTLVLREEDDDA